MVVVLALVTSACGPRDTVDLGVKQAGVDILYGDQAEEAPPSPPRPPGASLVPGFPAFIAPPAGVFIPPAGAPPLSPPPAPPVACPSADPFATPEKPVTPYVFVTPVEGAYQYRQQGSVQVGDEAPVPLPAQTIRRVENVVRDTPPLGSEGNFRFDVSETVGELTTTTTFRVENDGVSPGFKLARRVVTGGAEPEVFDPTPDVVLMSIPTAQEGFATNSTGTDPLTGTTMRLDRRTVERVLVNACGTPVQAWRVAITAGRTLNPAGGEDVSFEGTYDIAPQYGGMILSESITLNGVTDEGAVAQSNTTTINEITPTEEGR